MQNSCITWTMANSIQINMVFRKKYACLVKNIVESFHKFVRFDTELRKFKLNNKFTGT